MKFNKGGFISEYDQDNERFWSFNGMFFSVSIETNKRLLNMLMLVGIIMASDIYKAFSLEVTDGGIIFFKNDSNKYLKSKIFIFKLTYKYHN